MKKVTIPRCAHPFVVNVNGRKYIYPAGTEQEVPDAVAAIIEQHHKNHEESCNGVDVHNASYEAGYAKGQAEGGDPREAFWETFQQGGERLDYTGAFSSGWLPTSMFPPLYNIVPTSAKRMFYNANYTGELEDLLGGKRLVLNETTDEDLGANTEDCFRGSAFSSIGTIDLRGTDTTNFYMFAHMKNLTTIGKLYPPYARCECLGLNAFIYCSKLENLTIGSKITESLNFQWCPLSYDSLISIIEHLEDWDNLCDYYDDPLVLTLGATNIAKLTIDELAQITDKGWIYK